MSDIVHTIDTSPRVPSKTQTHTNTPYILTAFEPNRYFIFASPKKYHPIIAENAKKNIQIDIKISPNFPKTAENHA
ncbi:hypothetical protein [Terrisporobacter sp.]|uniref:hypothetical protein n=1 Tax=Terrisporobacter sp. TaxID=1965305 RepID=UPI003FCDC493